MSKKSLRSWAGVIAAGLLLVVTSVAVGWYAWVAGPAGAKVVGPKGWSTETRKQLKQHREAAQTYIQSGQIAKARLILKKLLEQYPQDAEARLLMAKVLITGEKTEEAYQQVTRSIELKPGQADAQFLAGILSRRLGEPERAKDHWERAAVLEPEDAKYRMYLGQLLMAMGDLDRAQMQLLKARTLDSSLAQVHAMLGEISARRGKLPMAMDQVNRALEEMAGEKIDKRLPYILQKAQLLRRANEPGAALRVLRELPREQREKQQVVEHMATCHLMKQEPEKAAALWAELFSRSPDNAQAAAEAGLCHLRAENRSDAEFYLGLAQRVDAEHEQVKALAEALREQDEKPRG